MKNEIDATKPNYLNINWEFAENSHIIDEKRRRYLDFTSSIFVANCGHGAVSEAIIDQAKKIIHCYTYKNSTKSKFIKELKDFLPDFCEKIYLASSGSEVTSWAIKLMKKYTSRNEVVHVKGAFHGKTGESGDLDGNPIEIGFPENMDNLDRDLRIITTNYDKIAGIIFETYRGYDGKFMDKSYVQKIVSLCNILGIPVCFDEIQSGFYRTGKKFGYEWYEVEPDLICLGKGIAGGMPLSALTGKEKYFTFSDMSSTHSGHPVCCAAGIKALEIYNHLDLEDLDEKSRLLKYGLRNIKKNSSCLKEVRSKGLMGCMEFFSNTIADHICDKALELGLILVNTGKNTIKIAPPLTILESDLLSGINILEDILCNK